MVQPLRVIFALAASAWLAVPVSAQTARATGTVHDADGKPIKGATIRAINPEIQPRQVISTSDAKGRWAMLGLRIGTYTFIVDAPGFIPMQGEAMVRTAATAPLAFTLMPEPGLIPGQMPSNILAQIAAANGIRDQGRIDQALGTYREILTKYPKLTALNLVIASAYREKAAREPDAAARRAALDRAIESYAEMLKSDPDNEQAKAGLSSTRAEVGSSQP